MTDKNATLVPEQGWHCLHLFYHVEYGQWQLLSREEQNAAKTNLSSLVQEVRAIYPTLPIVIASGQGRHELQQLFKDTALLSFVGKPYTSEELKAAIRAMAFVVRVRSSPWRASGGEVGIVFKTPGHYLPR